MNRRRHPDDIKRDIEAVKEYLCQWSHINPEQTGTAFINEPEFWDALKKPDSVLFSLGHIYRHKLNVQLREVSHYVRGVRNWAHDTFDYKPQLSRLEIGENAPCLIGFRLSFPDFDDAVLCKLRWL